MLHETDRTTRQDGVLGEGQQGDIKSRINFLRRIGQIGITPTDPRYIPPFEDRSRSKIIFSTSTQAIFYTSVILGSAGILYEAATLILKAAGL